MVKRIDAVLSLVVIGCQAPEAAPVDAGGDAPVLSCPATTAPWVQRLTSSADPSPASTRQNLTQWNWSRSLAPDENGGLHAVWTQLGSTSIEYPADKPDPVDTTQLPPGQIYYKRSLDGGQSWSNDLAMTAREAGIDSANVAASGSHVYVVWRAVDAGRQRVFFRGSADGGTSFGAPVAISDNPAGVSDSAPSIAAPAGGSTVYVVWADGRPHMVAGQTETTKEVYLASSPDYGGSWTAGAVSAPDGFSSWTPSVAAAGNAVHVAWTDERHDLVECTKGGVCREEEYYRRSLDGGLSWGPEVRLTADLPGMPAESWAPSIAAAQGTVHVAFFDKRSGLFQVYYKRSTDGGDSWDAEVLVGPAQGMTQSVRPTVAALDGRVHIAWFAYNDFPANIHYRLSLDGGASWDCPLVDVTQLGPTAAARIPHVAVTPDHAAHLIWYDTRHSDASGAKVEIYYGRLNAQ